MKMKLIFLLFMFVLIAHCQDYYEEEPEQIPCSSANATLYYANEKGEIIVDHYVDGKYQDYKRASIKINSTNVHALAYDYLHKEILFVDGQKPDAIWGVNQAFGVHLVVHTESVKFDWITADPVTNGIYFADNNQGLGVCFAHNKNTSCTILISQPTTSNTTIIYKDLILYPQHGILFWIQMEKGQESEVKVASMSGHHVRTLKDLNSTQGLALNVENGELIASLPDGELKKFNIQTHSIEDKSVFNHERLFFFNCNPHSLELQTKFSKRVCQNSECYESKTKSRLVLQNLNEVEKAFGSHSEFTKSAAILIIDKTPKTNLCKEKKCEEFCVIGEAYPDPVAECISSTSNQLKQISKVEIRMESNPLNVFLLILVILLTCVIIAGVALTFSSRLRLELRNLIARTFGKNKSTSFANPTSRNSTVSATTNDEL